MNRILCFLGLIALAVAAPKAQSQNAVAASGKNVFDSIPAVRVLPADVLRDFRGLCFASTLCKVFNVTESWDLSPFCGKSTCLRDPTHGYLVERVEDCGLAPKKTTTCKITNEANKDAPFPACCPKYECPAGESLEFPTQEELLFSQQEAAAEAASAASTNSATQ